MIIGASSHSELNAGVTRSAKSETNNAKAQNKIKIGNEMPGALL